MRTLITLALIAIAQMAFAQPFFIDSEPVIVQNQDGTYSWFMNGELTPISQPEGRLFSWEEMVTMTKGGVVTREGVVETTTIFSLANFPFFSIDKLTLQESFSLNEDGNVKVKTSEKTEELPTAGLFWLVTIWLTVVFGLGIFPPHKSWLSLLLVGISMISTIVASYHFGWWGFGTGLVALYASILWNQEGGYYSAFFFDLLGRPVTTVGVFGLSYFAFTERWNDRDSQMILMVTLSTIVAIAFVLSALYLRW